MPLTVPCVPTGMKAGVSKTAWRVVTRARRAFEWGSLARSSKRSGRASVIVESFYSRRGGKLLSRKTQIFQRRGIAVAFELLDRLLVLHIMRGGEGALERFDKPRRIKLADLLVLPLLLVQYVRQQVIDRRPNASPVLRLKPPQINPHPC